MKAIFATAYGPPEVLELREYLKPVIGSDEILVKVNYASITRADSMMRSGTPFYARLVLGLSKPKNPIVGTGFSGEVVEVGDKIVNFDIGQEVFGVTATSFGANAEFLKIKQSGVVLPKPEFLTHEEAAVFCDGPLTSWNFLIELAKLKENQHVLINGASGSLGLAALQIASQKKAKVTAVCSSRNEAIAREFGANRVICYDQQEVLTSVHDVDIFYDTLGLYSFEDCQPSLSGNGMYLSPVLSGKLLWNMFKTRNSTTQKALFAATGMEKEEKLKKMLRNLLELKENNELEIYIDRIFEMQHIVDAHRYIDSGHKKGNIILRIES